MAGLTSVVIYAAGSRLTDQHVLVTTDPHPIWIRVEKHDYSYEDSLDLAECGPGETVLNSIDATCLLDLPQVKL